jgi:hypothetical protein
MRFTFCFSRSCRAVTDDFRLAIMAVLPGREVPLFDGAGRFEAAFPFEEKLHAFSAAQTANRS